MPNYVIMVSPGLTPALGEATAVGMAALLGSEHSWGGTKHRLRGPLLLPHNISGLLLFAMLSGLPSNWTCPYGGEGTVRAGRA